MERRRPTPLPKIGFIGLGAMGQPMAQNLLEAGYPLTVFDVNTAAIDGLVKAGATAVNQILDLITHSDIIMTSLPSSAVFEQVAEGDLLPHVRAGQIIIDLGTTTGEATRHFAEKFAQQGVSLIDAPVSGGPGGSKQGNLRIFVGGDEAVVQQVWPLLTVLGDADHMAYCGPSSSGQAVKTVNQLAMGLVTAAFMEAIAFGANAGVDFEAIIKTVGGDSGWRGDLTRYARRLQAGEANKLYVKFPELPYFLDEAQSQDFAVPLTRALFEFCDQAERDINDNMNRPTVGLWTQLTTRKFKE